MDSPQSKKYQNFARCDGLETSKILINIKNININIAQTLFLLMLHSLIAI